MYNFNYKKIDSKDMVLSIGEVFAKAGSQRVALIKDGPIFYLVLNTKFNLIDPEFMIKCTNFLD